MVTTAHRPGSRSTDAAPDVVTSEEAGPAPGPAPVRPGPAYLRTALTPRMIVLLLLLLGAAAVCARLGVWQLDRAQERGRAAEVAEASAREGTPPVPLAEVLAPQQPVTGEMVGRHVTVTGTYEDDELLVVGRELDGRTGFLVLTPLRVTDAGAGEAVSDGGAGEAVSDGGASPAVLPVVRGWVESPEAAAALTPAPGGTVTVAGFLQGGEAVGEGGLPAGQVDAISTGSLANRWDGPIYSGYLVLRTSDPAQDDGLGLLPAPSLPGGGLNLQNLAYALQWWIFGGFAVLLWARLVRDEARAAAEEDGMTPDDPADVDGDRA